MTAINYLWDPVEDNIVREIDESGSSIAEYTTEPTHFGNVVSQHRGGETSYFHHDGRGSTLALTDGSQNVTDVLNYSAFGETTVSNGTTLFPFKYIGQKGYYTEIVTREVLVRRRPYHPVQGRWLASDPLQPVMSVYVYVNNSPLSFIDPHGLCLAKTDVDSTCGDDEDPCKGKLKQVKVCFVRWGDTKLKPDDLKLDKVNEIWSKCCIKLELEKTIQITAADATTVLGPDQQFDDANAKADPFKYVDARHRCRATEPCRIRIHIFGSVNFSSPDVGGFFDKRDFPWCHHIVFDPKKIDTLPIELILAHEFGHTCLGHCDDVKRDGEKSEDAKVPCDVDHLMHSTPTGTKLTESECKKCNDKF